MQSALDGEYAAIYAYGRAGARLGDLEQTARDQLQVHEQRRDQLRAWLDGGEPPAPAYQLPQPVTGPKSARRLLATVELRLIPLYTAVIADADPEQRAWAIRAIRNCALQAQSWGARGQAFPWPTDLPAPI